MRFWVATAEVAVATEETEMTTNTTIASLAMIEAGVVEVEEVAAAAMVDTVEVETGSTTPMITARSSVSWSRSGKAFGSVR
jgi:hypothetical protein